MYIIKIAMYKRRGILIKIVKNEKNVSTQNSVSALVVKTMYYHLDVYSGVLLPATITVYFL